MAYGSWLSWLYIKTTFLELIYSVDTIQINSISHFEWVTLSLSICIPMRYLVEPSWIVWNFLLGCFFFLRLRTTVSAQWIDWLKRRQLCSESDKRKPKLYLLFTLRPRSQLPARSSRTKHHHHHRRDSTGWYGLPKIRNALLFTQNIIFYYYLFPFFSHLPFSCGNRSQCWIVCCSRGCSFTHFSSTSSSSSKCSFFLISHSLSFVFSNDFTFCLKCFKNTKKFPVSLSSIMYTFC